MFSRLILQISSTLVIRDHVILCILWVDTKKIHCNLNCIATYQGTNWPSLPGLIRYDDV